MKRRELAILGLLLVGCGKGGDDSAPAGPPPTTDAAAPRPPAAATIELPRGDKVAIKLPPIELGMKFAPEISATAPFDKPCDDNATGGQGDGMRSLVVYQADGCVRIGPVTVPPFPERTSVIFYLARPPGIGISDTPLDQPVVAIAWMAPGRDYFSAHGGNFPLATGLPAADVDRAFGKPAATLALKFGLQARRYGNDVFALIDGDRAVGFAIGELPADAGDSRWYAFAAVWSKHTRDVAEPGHARP
jgi:hypothetical protein